ncbi:MAG: TRAP transporter large permease [Vicinamibacterales bacterium]
MAGVLVVLMGLILLGTPLVFALGLTTLGYLLAADVSLSLLPQRMAASLDSFTLLAIPLFYLSGELMNECKVTDRIIAMARAFVGHVPGSLAQVTVLAGTLLSGVSGSATADTAALGSVLIPAMKREGYDSGFAAAVTVSSAMVGPIIPPSILLVMYGILANLSIGKLLVAGIVPGLVIGLTLMAFNHVIAVKRGFPRHPRASVRDMATATSRGTAALLMPVLIVGGILSGAFTATEAAAVSVVYGLVLGLVVYRNVSVASLWGAMQRVCTGSARVLVILAVASAFSWVVILEEVPQAIVGVMLGITSSPMMVLFLVVSLLLVVGTFLVASSALVILAPILVPVMQRFGFDPIHFGVLMVFILVVGGGTPPVGVLLYVAQDIADVEYGSLVRAMLPFYIPLGIAILLLALFPQLTLFVPQHFM